MILKRSYLSDCQTLEGRRAGVVDNLDIGVPCTTTIRSHKHILLLVLCNMRMAEFSPTWHPGRALGITIGVTILG